MWCRIVSYMTRQHLPPLTAVTSSNIKSFQTVDSIVIIAYLGPEHNDLADVFEAVANTKHQSFVFGLTMDPEIATEEGLPVPSVVSYKTIEGGKEILKGAFGREQLEGFMKTATTPVIGEITRRNIDRYFAVSAKVFSVLRFNILCSRLEMHHAC